MDLYLIKDDCLKVIDINEDIDIKNPHSTFLDKYVNKDNYSLVIHNDKRHELIICINKNITRDSCCKILDTFRNLNDNKKIFNFKCYNYLDEDYEIVNSSNRYEMDSSVTLFCEEKLGNKSCYVKNILKDFRTLNLRDCLLDKYKEHFPNNRNRGVILISENKREDISLTKETHSELIDEYSKKNKWDLNNNIVVTVSSRLLFIEVPNFINEFQRNELMNIEKQVSYVKDMYMPVYVDVLKRGKIYKDIGDILDVKVKKKR